MPKPWVQRFGALLPDHRRWQVFIGSQMKRSEYLQPGQVVEASIRSSDGVIDLGVQRNLVTQGA